MSSRKRGRRRGCLLIVGTVNKGIRRNRPLQRSALFTTAALAVVVLCLVAAHLSVLRTPYFWDEIYFASEARDFFLTGKVIPTSVAVESHPPLVSLWIVGWWKVFGFSIVAAHTAMLTASVVTLGAVYRLARLCTTGKVAIVATALTALYPVFFSHSTMVQLDMPAACLALWGLVAYLRARSWASGLLFGLAALAKETAIVAPLAILMLECILDLRNRERSDGARGWPAWRTRFPLLMPLPALFCWYAWLYHATGTPFGDAGYMQFNLYATLHPVRIVLALARHLWHLLGYLNLFVLTGPAVVICAFWPSRLVHEARGHIRYMWQVFAAVITGHLIVLSIVGGAELARYLLPVYPLVILASLAAIARRVRWWPVMAVLTAAAFIVGLFAYPRWYGFAREDNLAYLDYVALHRDAAGFVANEGGIKVLTTWPGSLEVTEPWLGYIGRPVELSEVESFTKEELIPAKQNFSGDILLFPAIYVPPHPFLEASWWLKSKRDYFSYDELPLQEVARLMNARVISLEKRRGDWVAVLRVAGAGGMKEHSASH